MKAVVLPERKAATLRARGLPFVFAAALLFAAVALGTVVGAADLPVGGVLLALLDSLPLISVDHGLTPVQHAVLMELRVPRVLLGAMVGGLLAIAGAGYQGVFRNPMADPYLLGASSGAGLGATLVIVYSPVNEFAGIGVIPLAAFGGALTGVLMAYALGATTGRADSSTNLLLAGVAVSAFLSAVQTFVQQSKVDQLQRIYAWILGSLSDANWDDLQLLLPYAALSVTVLLAHGRLLDVMAVGDDEASVLGVNAGRTRLIVLFAASLATASAVAVSGLIGFIGIVVPHIVRRIAGGSYRRVLPLSLIIGGAFLVLADVLARTLTAPAELPIGVVTAFIGAPFFVLILRTTRRIDL